MQYRFFRVPAGDPGPFEEELNRFLRGHRVVQVQRELVREDGGAWWAICVEYLPASVGTTAGPNGTGKAKVDYRELLAPDQFVVFSRLRDLRKQMAERDAVPVYAVFTNEQIAAMVTGQADSMAALRRIDGVGEARAEKYGEAFLGALREAVAGPPADAAGKEAPP